MLIRKFVSASVV